MDFKVELPIYRQIADLCHERIISGEWAEDQRIPSVRELGLELCVNAHTVLKAYDLLQKEDIIESRRGLGYYLAPDARSRVSQARREEFLNTDLPEFIRKSISLGITPEDLISHLRSL